MKSPVPHQPYITAIEAALTEAQLTPERADAFVEDSYDVPWLRGVITLTPETSDYPGTRFAHGVIAVWDWHTGVDADFERGPLWQWARLNEDGSNQELEPLPVPGWIAPPMFTATVATLVHAGTPSPMASTWHEHLRMPVEAAVEEWAANLAGSSRPTEAQGPER